MVDVNDLDRLVVAVGGELVRADPAERADSHLVRLRRSHTHDPVGNRLELVGT